MIIAHVQLQYFLPRPAAGVGDVDADCQLIARQQMIGAKSQIAVAKCGVGKAVAEREQRLDQFLIVVAIADEDALAIADPAVLAWVVNTRWVVLQRTGEG